MAGEETEYDVSELPNFGALRTALEGSPSRQAILDWVAKLEGWCKASMAENADTEQKLQGEIEKSDEALAKAERELEETRAAAEELDHLRDAIMDVERGIRTHDELVEQTRPLIS